MGDVRKVIVDAVSKFVRPARAEKIADEVLSALHENEHWGRLDESSLNKIINGDLKVCDGYCGD